MNHTNTLKHRIQQELQPARVSIFELTGNVRQDVYYKELPSGEVVRASSRQELLQKLKQTGENNG